jgi:hypothetical protein
MAVMLTGRIETVAVIGERSAIQNIEAREAVEGHGSSVELLATVGLTHWTVVLRNAHRVLFSLNQLGASSRNENGRHVCATTGRLYKRW